MKRIYGLNLIEKAVIANEWRHTALEASMVAICSLDSKKMVDKAGRVLFVVLGASVAEGADAESIAMKLLVGAINAVHDQAGNEIIPAMSRKAIISGLETAAALIPQLSRKSLVDAACDLALKLRRGDVHLSDFLLLKAA